MAGYIGPIPVPQATQTRETFTATASQTTFNTAGYQPGYLDVFMNGVKLIDGSDYTATNGSDVVLSSGAAINDLIEVVAYTAFEVLNQNFTGTTTVADLTVTGDLTVDGTTTTINSTTLNVDDINITVASGAADAAAANGAGLTVDGANATFNYASSGDKWTMNKPLDSAGIVSAVDRFFVSGTAPQVRLSPTSGDAVDSDRAMFGLATSDGHFFADALDGDAILRSPTNGKLLFGTGLTERARLHNNGSFAIGTTADQHASSTAEGIYLYPGSSSSMSANSPVLRLNRNGTGGNNRSNLELYNNGTLRGFLGTLGVEGGMYFGSGNGAATNMTLYEDETVVNEESIDHDFRVESNNRSAMLFVDASADRVGINTDAPQQTLEVRGKVLIEANNSGATSIPGNQLILSDSDESIDANQLMGQIAFNTADLTNPGTAAKIQTRATNTLGSGELQIWSGTPGGMNKNVHFRGDQAVFNEDSEDMDFRVESGNFSNAIIVDASSNLVGFVDVGTAPWAQTSGQGVMTYRLTEGSMALSNNGTNGYAGLYINKFNASSDNRAISFYREGGTEGHLRVDATQGVKYGTSTNGGATATVELNKLGITFDGGSNYLDDYEEGNWSPASSSGSNPLTVQGSGNRYTKIGRQVIAYFDISWNSGNTGTGSAIITGLPFLPSSNHEGDGAATIGYITGSAGVDFVIHCSNSATQFVFYPDGSGGSSTYAQLAGRRIAGYIQYYTNA